MKLSMIVLITSWDPNLAFNIPGIAPHNPPTTIAAKMHKGTSKYHGRLIHDQFSSFPKMFTTVPPNLIPTHAVENAATYNCPSPPMFSSPHRKATATANPVNIKGVA